MNFKNNLETKEQNISKKDISLIIPYLNNPPALHNNILLLIDKMKEINNNYEIIIIDDYSEHSVPESINKCKKLCKYFRNNSNMGKGYSIKRGVLNSIGDIIIFIDSDLPYRLDSLKLFFEAHKEGYDIAIGDRTHSNSGSDVQISIFRKLLSFLYKHIAHIIIRGHFNDTQCGMKSFTRKSAFDVFPLIVSNGFAFDVEILMIANHKNFAIKKIPVHLINNTNSTIRFLKDGISTIGELFVLLLNKIFNVKNN